MEHTGSNEQSLLDSSISIPDTNNNTTPASQHSGKAKGAFVCGIIAVSLNVLAFTVVIGFILSIISIVLGANTYRQSVYGKSGLVLGLLSIFVILAYVLSGVVIMIADPFV